MDRFFNAGFFVFIFSLVVFLSISLLIYYIDDQKTHYRVKLIKISGLRPTTGLNYKLDGEIIFRVENRQITIPSGFETDLASIPRIFWPFLAPNDDYFVYPSIIHDYLYSCGGWVDRKYSDDVLRSFLEYAEVPDRKISIFYIGVRIFGARHFSKRNNNCKYLKIG